METMGDRIRELRKRKNTKSRRFTQADLAKAMGVQEKQISKWENNEIELNSDKIIRLADFFGVSADYLLRGGEVDSLVMINETGLSDQTINRLREHKQNGKTVFADAINLLMSPEIGFALSDPIGENLLREIYHFVKRPDQQIRAVNVNEPNLMDFISTDDLYQIRLINSLSSLKMFYQQIRERGKSDPDLE